MLSSVTVARPRNPFTNSSRYERLFKALSEEAWASFPHYTHFRDVEVLLLVAIHNIMDYFEKKQIEYELMYDSSLRLQYIDLRSQLPNGPKLGLPCIRGKSDAFVRELLQNYFLAKIASI
jgi:hypothetical protein